MAKIYKFKNILLAALVMGGGLVFSFNLSNASSLVGDLNDDGRVDVLDWSIMSEVWFTNDPTADLDDSGFVNSLDFSILNGNWFKTLPPPLPPVDTLGWVGKIYTSDGVITGMVYDKNNPSTEITANIYIDGNQNSKGTLIGTARAEQYNIQTNWDLGIPGNHGFTFHIPKQYFDNQQHKYKVEPVDALGRLGPMAGMSDQAAGPITLSSANKNPRSQVTNASCLSSSSRCDSYGNDYFAPNFPSATGWNDGVNYFDKWKCTATNDINYIARLNIIPKNNHGLFFQKDSLHVNLSDSSNPEGDPWVFFTSSSYDHSSFYSLKKAEFDKAAGKWKVYSVLDNPYGSGGLSSQDGRGKNFIMNDYSLPGWGPSSPTPGSSNLIPGVSNVSASSSVPSYPLVGSGPLGITAIMNAKYPSTVSGGPEGRTCIHMNPKLFDYDGSGRPQSMIIQLWQNTTAESCQLPPGAPMARLPSAGTYIYRYKGSTLGWQLDLDTGLVKDSISDYDSSPLPALYKLLPNTSRTFISATWDGIIFKMDLDKPQSSNATKILDCKASGVHVGEATARDEESIFFLANPPGEVEQISPNVFIADIFYAFKN